MGDYDENNLLFETNENGEQVVIRSLESRDRAYIRFINRTSRPVDIWWRDFQGRRRHYMRMEAKSYFSIDTYVTHPWEFTDPATKENYMINNKIIFRVPRAIAGMPQRTSWIISVCIRPLRSTVMLTLAERIRDQSRVSELGLPRELEADLGRMIDAVQNTPPPPPRP